MDAGPKLPVLKPAERAIPWDWPDTWAPGYLAQLGPAERSERAPREPKRVRTRRRAAAQRTEGGPPPQSERVMKDMPSRVRVHLSANPADRWVEVDGERRDDVVAVSVHGGAFDPPVVELHMEAEVDADVELLVMGWHHAGDGAVTLADRRAAEIAEAREALQQQRAAVS